MKNNLYSAENMKKFAGTEWICTAKKYAGKVLVVLSDGRFKVKGSDRASESFMMACRKLARNYKKCTLRSTQFVDSNGVKLSDAVKTVKATVKKAKLSDLQEHILKIVTNLDRGDSHCYARNTTIAQYAKVSADLVYQVLGELRRKGYIEFTKAANGVRRIITK